MPGAKWDKEAKCWRVSLAPSDRSRLLELAERLGLEVARELLDIPEIPGVQEGVARAVEGGAYPYQVEGVRWLASHDAALLGDDMGLGKTAQVLWAIPEGYGVVVVCPKSLKLTWAAECKKWRPDLTPVVLEGRGSFTAWPSAGVVLITNYEILPTEVPAAPACGVILVEDEAHRAKSHKAQRTKRVRAMAKAADKCWLLTGTPLLGRPFDLWGVLEAGRMGRDVFGGWHGFVRSFGGFKNRWGGYEFRGPDDSVPERLRRVMIRRTKAEVLPDLPSKRYETHEVAVPVTLGREIDRWCDENEWHGEEELPDFKLFSGIRAKLAASRVDAAVEFCEDCEEQDVPLLVFSAHRAPVEKIGEREGWGAILGGTPPEERQRLVDAFQAGELKGLALTIGAGGVGLTLTRASTVLFVDLDWTPGNNLQAEDRVARIGQTADMIRIVRMVSDHILDRHIHALLAMKQDLIQRSIDAAAKFEIPDSDTLDVLDETEEQWQSRVAAAQGRDLELAKDEAGRKVQKKVRQLIVKGRRMPTQIDEAHAAALREAVRFLAERCDGAEARDGAGFNKPDAAIGNWLSLTKMVDLPSLQLAWAITRKYARQAGHIELAYDEAGMGGAA